MLPGGVSSYEMILVGIVALLLFGKNLPDVARKAGKSLAEFKRGMTGLQREFQIAMDDTPTKSRSSSSKSTSTAARRPEPLDDRMAEVRAPRFAPPAAPPHAES